MVILHKSRQYNEIGRRGSKELTKCQAFKLIFNNFREDFALYHW
jgi:hypothetical protein